MPIMSIVILVTYLFYFIVCVLHSKRWGNESVWWKRGMIKNLSLTADIAMMVAILSVCNILGHYTSLYKWTDTALKTLDDVTGRTAIYEEQAKKLTPIVKHYLDGEVMSKKEAWWNWNPGKGYAFIDPRVIKMVANNLDMTEKELLATKSSYKIIYNP